MSPIARRTHSASKTRVRANGALKMRVCAMAHGQRPQLWYLRDSGRKNAIYSGAIVATPLFGGGQRPSLCLACLFIAVGGAFT
jgi:hypothetical protein